MYCQVRFSSLVYLLLFKELKGTPGKEASQVPWIYDDRNEGRKEDFLRQVNTTYICLFPRVKVLTRILKGGD